MIMVAFEKSFASYEGKTPSGKKKVDCWSSKNKFKPYEVSKGTHKKVWFDCDICRHDFESRLSNITYNKHWCPYCSNQKLCIKNNCNHCYHKSFASYEGKTPSGKKKVDCWSSKNKFKPREVFKGTNKKCLFNCYICSHDFDSLLNNVTCHNRWCPYCSNQKLCIKNNCNHCYNKSFASYEGKTPSGKKKVDCWSSKNKFKPREVFKGTHKKCWFNCDKCGHDFETAISSISGKRSRWCPYCSNQKLCIKSNCNHCYHKSFASYEGTTPSGKKKVDCWSIKNKLTAREVFKVCGKNYWFDCDKCGNDFESIIANMTRQNSWCPKCYNKTELKLYNWLLKREYIKTVKKEWKPTWCSTEYTHIVKTKFKIGKYQYRYDFLVTLKNKKQIIIELDGPQHYEQVRDWKTPLEQQIRDKYKEFKAREKGLDIIRCYQEDVLMDRNEWDDNLNRKLLCI